MTEVCREWTQPDGLHFRGLCGNEFMPKTGVEGCNICATPKLPPIATCCCPEPVNSLRIMYLKAVYSGLGGCQLTSGNGEFAIKVTNCGAASFQAMASQRHPFEGGGPCDFTRATGPMWSSNPTCITIDGIKYGNYSFFYTYNTYRLIPSYAPSLSTIGPFSAMFLPACPVDGIGAGTWALANASQPNWNVQISHVPFS